MQDSQGQDLFSEFLGIVHNEATSMRLPGNRVRQTISLHVTEHIVEFHGEVLFRSTRSSAAAAGFHFREGQEAFGLALVGIVSIILRSFSRHGVCRTDVMRSGFGSRRGIVGTGPNHNREPFTNKNEAGGMVPVSYSTVQYICMVW